MSTTRRFTPDRPVDAYGSFSTDGDLTEQQFQQRANLREGVAGQASMDTTFENTELDIVNQPRSAPPAPMPELNETGDL